MGTPSPGTVSTKLQRIADETLVYNLRKPTVNWPPAIMHRRIRVGLRAAEVGLGGSFSYFPEELPVGFQVDLTPEQEARRAALVEKLHKLGGAPTDRAELLLEALAPRSTSMCTNKWA